RRIDRVLGDRRRVDGNLGELRGVGRRLHDQRRVDGYRGRRDDGRLGRRRWSLARDGLAWRAGLLVATEGERRDDDDRGNTEDERGQHPARASRLLFVGAIVGIARHPLLGHRARQRDQIGGGLGIARRGGPR